MNEETDAFSAVLVFVVAGPRAFLGVCAFLADGFDVYQGCWGVSWAGDELFVEKLCVAIKCQKHRRGVLGVEMRTFANLKVSATVVLTCF